MSSRLLDFLPERWTAQHADLWRVALQRGRDPHDADGAFLVVDIGSRPAREGPASSCLTYELPEPLSLTDVSEARLWLRCSKASDRRAGRPCFLSFEMTRGPDAPVEWSRRLPVAQAGRWELHCLWIEDMPQTLRGAVATLRLRADLGPEPVALALSGLLAVRPQPIQDVDEALMARLSGDRPGIGSVVAQIELPEGAAPSTAPYILVSPLSIAPQGHRGGSGDVEDNLTEQGLPHLRPRPHTLELAFRIDVHAQNRQQKAKILDEVLADFARRPFLVVNHERLPLLPYSPGPEEAHHLAPPGRTPLFYRVQCEIECGTRTPPALIQSVALQPQEPPPRGGQPV